jgi:hypothetical protein
MPQKDPKAMINEKSLAVWPTVAKLLSKILKETPITWTEKTYDSAHRSKSDNCLNSIWFAYLPKIDSHQELRD